MCAIARQIFDESIDCLRVGEDCKEIDGIFRDDDIIRPLPDFPSDELEDIDQFNENEVLEA